MKIFAKSAKATSACLTALLLVINLPLSAMAEAVAVSPPPTSSPTTTQPQTTYTYNPTTGHWDTNEWYYDATTGTYKAIPQPVVVTTQPAATTTPTVVTPQGGTQTQTPTDSVGQLNANNQTNATNAVNSAAGTGNATVILNTEAGNATTGNAASTATILNDVNSVLSMADNQKAASFVTDVMGNVNGDILLQPMILKAMLESGGTGTGSSIGTTVASVNNTNNLTNNINLSAASGNAGVIGNTKAGNATSGSADTVANVVNIINSMIAANKSFVGTINIYGNLNGDILIAPNFLSQLIASNGSDTSKTGTTVVSADNVQSIVNNISMAAESGKAAVMDNTKAGSATSGDSSTNVVIFNLTGHEVVASDSLLVFVNVLGKWVGVIVDAPKGATAAALGSGVTKNSTTALPDLTIISSDNNNLITNNINLSSQSGNATVAANTLAGNAVSGNATASANIANISSSQFGLTGWFGVLFINVFGNWYGSFGINTPYGNPAVNKSNVRAVEFIPSTGESKSKVTVITKNGSDQYSAYSVNQTEKNSGSAAVLASSGANDAGIGLPKAVASTSGSNLPILGGSILITLVSAAGLSRSISDRKGRLIARFLR